MQNNDNILNRKRFDRMCKNLKMSHKDLAMLTGNAYESIRKVLSKEVPRWAMLAVNIDEFNRNTPNVNLYESIEELFTKTLSTPDYDDTDKIKSIIAHLNFGFTDYPLSPEKKAIVDKFQEMLN